MNCISETGEYEKLDPKTKYALSKKKSLTENV